jgi:hypothetical protein
MLGHTGKEIYQEQARNVGLLVEIDLGQKNHRKKPPPPASTAHPLAAQGCQVSDCKKRLYGFEKSMIYSSSVKKKHRQRQNVHRN